MEASRATLFDHLAIRHSSTLRDLLSHRDAAGDAASGGVGGGGGGGGALTLATALAYERSSTTTGAVGERTLLDFIRGEGEIGWSSPGVRVRASLMSLMEDWEEEEEGEGEEKEKGVGERRHVCCVCVEREKGAAMVPCGHTFCRVCARKVWRSRGSCPLCNASIAQVLHIF
ncbi:uncharacterized protein [Typha angustifolia]|uniref:uncharacterized protein n=1 Tax=Typha angustifolia TaxID=59011 RepID=UPI003C2E94D6